MNKRLYYWIIALLLVTMFGLWFFAFANTASASAILECPAGQQVGSVLITPAVPGTPEIPGVNWHRHCTNWAWWGCVSHSAYHWDVNPIPATPGTPAVYADQCVAIEGYVPPTPPTPPTPKFFGGGSAMIWCSGPSAPGWNVSLPNGGCIKGEIAGGNYNDDIMSIQLRLIDVMKQLIELLRNK